MQLSCDGASVTLEDSGMDGKSAGAACTTGRLNVLFDITIQ